MLQSVWATTFVQFFETDPRRLQKRQKQIYYGKNTVEYQRFISEVLLFEQKITIPDKFQICSKRSWDGQVFKLSGSSIGNNTVLFKLLFKVRVWRKQLHEWAEKKDGKITLNQFIFQNDQQLLSKYIVFIYSILIFYDFRFYLISDFI